MIEIFLVIALAVALFALWLAYRIGLKLNDELHLVHDELDRFHREIASLADASAQHKELLQKSASSIGEIRRHLTAR